MSECQGCTVPHETYTVTVRYPKSLRTRVANKWNRCPRPCCRHLPALCIFWVVIFIVIVGFVGFVFSLCVTLVVDYCHKAPRMELQSFSIRDMAVYQNGTTAGWQVDSAFNVTLGTKNPCTVAGCFTTIRRVLVRVEYKRQTIVDQDVPLGLGLKPRRSRPATKTLQGQQFPLNNPDVGPYLRAEMERDNVTMDICLYARYLRNDRSTGSVEEAWLRGGGFGAHTHFQFFQLAALQGLLPHMIVPRSASEFIVNSAS